MRRSFHAYDKPCQSACGWAGHLPSRTRACPGAGSWRSCYSLSCACVCVHVCVYCVSEHVAMMGLCRGRF